MTFSLRQYADVNTRYLEESDLPLLVYEQAPNHLANVDGNAGSIFWVPIDNYGEVAKEWEEFGFSPRFLAIMRSLADQGVQYVRFDRDGDEIED